MDLLDWPTEHLIDAAGSWAATGKRWYETFDGVWQDSASVDWEGVAAEQLRARTRADRLKVSGLDDQLQHAAKVARIGATDLHAARSRLQYVVEDAHAAGFVVAEDLSVVDRSTGGTTFQQAARQVQAETYSSDIRQRAAQLIGLDRQVADKISMALAGIGSITFDEVPALGATTPTRHWGIQLVDWKQSPEPTPGPTAQDIREAIKNLPQSSRPDIREVRTEDQLRSLWEWLSKNGQEYTSQNPYRDGLGAERQLPDGTRVRIGESKKWGTTMDITLPNGEDVKLHFNAKRGGELNIPGQAGGPVAPRAIAPEPPAGAPVTPDIKPPPARTAPLPTLRPPFPIGGTVPPPESIPHPVHAPHSHHGPPVLGKDELADLPEFNPE